MKKNKLLSNVIAGLFFSSFIFSCNSTISNQADGRKREQYSINPDIMTERITTSKYSVDSICSLNLPDDIIEMGRDKISVVNGCVYILDTEISKKLYIFDGKGNLKTTIGERGHASDEFIGKPDDFFVDSNNKIHVFDKIGHKIIVYNEDGSVNRIIYTEKFFPCSIGLTGNNRYMMYFTVGHKEENNERELPSSLLLFKHDCKSYEVLMSSVDESYRIISKHTFFQDGDRLSFIPCYSDSVIVFRNDTIEKVVSFDFGGKVLIKEKPEILKQDDDSLLDDYDGVLGLRRYQETDSLVYIDYIYQNHGLYWIYNKNTCQKYNGSDPFEGINPYTYFILSNNQIIGYVDKEKVAELKHYVNNRKFREDLERSPQHVKDMIDGKIKVPALVFMTLK